MASAQGYANSVAFLRILMMSILGFQQTDDTLARLLDRLPEAAFVIDDDRKILWCNKVFLQVAGLNRENVVGEFLDETLRKFISVKPLEVFTGIWQGSKAHYFFYTWENLTREEEIGFPQERKIHPAFSPVLGNSASLLKTLGMIEKVVATGISILLRGESGTGKELFAKGIHQASDRSMGPFVVVNCSAISPDLAESLFFGHQKGAFTGAENSFEGYFTQADQGTLFLDEIGDMPYNLQAKILRVLEDKTVQPVGSSKKHVVDFRLVAATNQDLEALIQQGLFRSDLYYRINEYPIIVPSLRERDGDIEYLAHVFLQKIKDFFELGPKSLLPQVVERLKLHLWPGNVRELKSVIERLALMSQEMITLEDLETIPMFQQGSRLEDHGSLADKERFTILAAWNANQNRLDPTAKSLGIGRTTVYRKLKSYGVI